MSEVSVKREDSLSPKVSRTLFGQPVHHATAAPRFPPRTSAQSPLSHSSCDSSTNLIKMEPDFEMMDSPDLAHGDAPCKADYLERLCAKNTPEVLEAGVSVATKFLEQLQKALNTYKTPDVEVWLKNIEKLQNREALPRTVIGVVGSTGAGKSSVINALVDEERLLPTNCIRACTASPTEISYNHSDDPQELYYAEIEFISEEDWIRELQVLFNDLLDSNGHISREANSTGSEASIAYAKVKAVYPQKTREMIAQANPKDLANEPAIRSVLGSTKIIKDQTAKGLYSRLQRYVDSAEKPTDSTERRKRVDIPIEYWPLIKVVRLKTKADALATGAVIVDLPGVQDSNVARAAVADKYMQTCTGLWIVAPITRAVDDKVAKTLLGDSFRRQLKYDGSYTGVSFICSKTDDISVSEAAESLEIEVDVSEKWDAFKKLEVTDASYKSQVASIRGTKAKLREKTDECEAEIDLWENLESKLSTGKTVYAPSSNPRKRKRSASPEDIDSDDLDDSDAIDSSSSDEESSSPEQNRTPLTEKEIEEHISSLRSKRKTLRKEKRPLDLELIRLTKEMGKIKAERHRIIEEIRASCIKGRNNYSRGAIKNDFAKGVKELDQENAALDDENFDPEKDMRDYEALARDLPVFCVSSRVYQKLRGRFEKDNMTSQGFISVEDTEIPELQKYAKKLTEARRAMHCRSFLNELFQLVNSMTLWSWNNGSMSSLMHGEKEQEKVYLRKLLGQLNKELESALQRSINLIWKSIEAHVFENIHASVPTAVEAAPQTANSWGAPRSEGGLAWSTYKATVRRMGVYGGASGHRDFNQDLFDPIFRSLANSWEQAFQYQLPAVLGGFAKETAEKLEQFHLAAKARAQSRQTNIAGLFILSDQILAHIRTVQALPETIRHRITELQREASRQFTPVIREQMMDAYTICTNEKGPGSFVRMKSAMSGHIEIVRHDMFHEASAAVRAELEVMCQTVKLEIAGTIHEVFEAMCKDYLRTLVGANKANSDLCREEKNMRDCVHKVLLGGDKLFQPVLGEPSSESLDGTSQHDVVSLFTLQ
ncbi:hypothetical protein GGS21DRAFT_510278 [Xylaria nigripes]|nr:hypothetical protein GGS21DRAFT_510278 [Xylaria nigripes]